MFLRRAVLCALVVGLALPADLALADDPPRPSDIPAIAAYIEMVPTSRGPKQAGAGKARSKPLPPRVDELLRERGGDDAALLERLATSPAYGAPTARPRKQPATPNARSGSPEESDSDALSAAVSVSAEGSEARMLGLLAALLGVTAAIGVVAARRRAKAPS